MYSVYMSMSTYFFENIINILNQNIILLFQHITNFIYLQFMEIKRQLFDFFDR